MTKLLYHRQSRTQTSEQYEVMQGDRRLGHLDVHFGSREVYGTLILDEETPEDELETIIEDIDENVVLSSDVPREDFLIHVYVGREVGLYSDELLRDTYVANGNAEFEDE